MVERVLSMHEVAGSIPASSIFYLDLPNCANEEITQYEEIRLDLQKLPRQIKQAWQNVLGTEATVVSRLL